MSEGRDERRAVDKREDRVFQVLTVAVAGLIGFGGAWLGAETSLTAADKQIAAQREDSQTEFLRNERRAAYGGVITLDNQLNDAELSLLVFEPKLSERSAERLREQVRRLRTLTDRLKRANSTVVLVGSSSLANAGDELVDAHEQYVAAVTFVATLRQAAQLPAVKEEDGPRRMELLNSEVGKARERLTKAQAEFIARSRIELAHGIDTDLLDLDT